MTKIIETTDPLGRKVVCESVQWYGHIVTSHPMMNGKISNVESAVSNPDYIFKSDSHDDRDVYFQTYSSPDLNTKVVVDMSSDPGNIITAFIQKGVKGNIDKGVVKYAKT